jgi:hypothetical protein
LGGVRSLMLWGRTVTNRLQFSPRDWAAKYQASVRFATTSAERLRLTLRRPIFRLRSHPFHVSVALDPAPASASATPFTINIP